jgi:hypothetical protein
MAAVLVYEGSDFVHILGSEFTPEEVAELEAIGQANHERLSEPREPVGVPLTAEMVTQEAMAHLRKLVRAKAKKI